MKKLQYLFCIISLIGISCTKQRDLYVKARPMFIIKNDWSIANLTPEGATVMLYPRSDPKELMVDNPYRLRMFIPYGTYEMLVVNEVMFSPSETNIQSVTYRGTDKFSTFGAYAKAGTAYALFRGAEDGLMVGNNYPHHVATDHISPREVLDDAEYLIKYRDGKNGFSTPKDFDADSVEFTPVRVTRDVQIVAHVRHLRDKFKISGALRGFAEGVLLHSRQPSGTNATYTFDLNSPVAEPDVPGGHILVSPVFTTFGPWWSDYPSSRKYTLDLFAAWGADIFPFNFDVTEITPHKVTKSVGQAISIIRQEENSFKLQRIYPAMNTIIIEVWFDLPEVLDEFLDVGVSPWGQDIIVPVPIPIP